MFRVRFFIFVVVVMGGFLSLGSYAHAAALTRVSDLVSSSIPATNSDHIITFTVTNAVPAGGKISIVFDPNFFTIPSGLDYTDIDFLVANSQRSLGGTADSATDGVSVTTGSVAPAVLITLNSTTGINAGQAVEVRIGQAAVFGTSGDQQIMNPVQERSLRITIQTRDSSDVAIDTAQTKVMTILPVTVGPVDTIDVTPPGRYNGLPSGALPAGVTYVEISLNTAEEATCRYSTTAETPYSSMVNIFSSTGNSLHSTDVGPFTNGQSYTYYVRCSDIQNNSNIDDFAITFSIKNPPPSGTVPGPVGGPEGEGGSPPSGNGGQPYPLGTAEIALQGWAYPFSKVTVLKDGKAQGTYTAGSDGAFSITVSGIDKGKYTFTLYAEDANGKRSGSYSVTEALIGGTRTEVLNVFLTPTIQLGKQISASGLLNVSGYSLARGNADVWLYKKAVQVADSSIIKKTASASASGFWSVDFDTSALGNSNSYVVQARSIRSTSEKSAFTVPLAITVTGSNVEAEPQTPRSADINGDGKVNLIDFSILLFNWGIPSNPAADINADDSVNLTDFSIMLFNWTG